MGIMSSSSRLWGGICNNVEESAGLGWLAYLVFPGCQTDAYDAHCVCQWDSWASTLGAGEYCIGWHRLRVTFKLSCGIWWLQDFMLVRLEWINQVCNYKMIYRIVLCDIFIIYYHTRGVWLQVHRNYFGDHFHSPSSSKFLPTERIDFIAFWRHLHTL